MTTLTYIVITYKIVKFFCFLSVDITIFFSKCFVLHLALLNNRDIIHTPIKQITNKIFEGYFMEKLKRRKTPLI